MKRLAITTAVTIVLLLGTEAGLRAWAFFFRHPYQRLDARSGMIRLVPNVETLRQGRRIAVNSLGFRGHEFSPKKPAGVVRIVALGDSVTFGEPGEACPYPAQLERLLNAGPSGRKFEVINAGVEGYNSRDALWLLQHEVLQYQPDLVTVLIGWNDLVKHDPGRPDASAVTSTFAYDLYDVYLIKAWRKVVFAYLRPLVLSVDMRRLPEAEARAYRTYVPYVFQHNLEQMIGLANLHHAHVVLFTLPSPLDPQMGEEDIKKLYWPSYTYNLEKFFTVYSRYNETIRAVGRKTGVPVLDLARQLRGRGDLFNDTAHPTCDGAGVVAAEISRFLQIPGVIESPDQPLGSRD